MRRLPIFLSLLLVCPLIAQKHRASVASPSVIRIGGLFATTGGGATLGNASVAALDLAASDIDAEMEALRLPYRVETDSQDTGQVPATALLRLMSMDANGDGYVIGPQTSAEAGNIVAFANLHNIIVVSQASTASSLAIPGDNLFRLAPNDKLEGAAIAALMRADGIDTVVPIWRADAGNIGLHDSTAASFTATGGTVAAGVQYDPSTTDFTATVSALGAAVRSVKNAKPPAKIAVYIASFEEASSIFDLARLDADLAAVRWYGGDGVVQSQALLAKSTVANFAAATQFTAPNVGLDDATKDVWKPVSDAIQARVGFAPDAYSLSVYDAAWVIALSFIESRGSSDTRRESFVRNVQRYWGLTGSTALDANGDRKSGNFDFWTVQNGQWVRTAQYAGGHVAR
ncbi:MAG TPA: ABC transporter substrate-binding protein [Thermoanaerobaculia bacterium]